MDVIVLYPNLLPNMATHVAQERCGFTIYRNVYVQWDEDHDSRILDFLDDTPSGVLDKLLVVQEHEGVIAFVWRGEVPAGYEEGESIEVRCGDVWSVYKSSVRP